jgi:hypothetical protein
MTHTTYRLLRDQSVLERIKSELDQAYPDPNEEMTLEKLEPLPFLVCLPQIVACHLCDHH